MNISIKIVATAACLAGLFVMTAIAALFIGMPYVALASIVAVAVCAIVTITTILVEIWTS